MLPQLDRQPPLSTPALTSRRPESAPPQRDRRSPLKRHCQANDSKDAIRALSQRARWAAGQPISDLMHRALAHPELISLAAGFVDQESLPVEAVRIGAETVLSDPVRARAALQYGTTPGYQPLREQLLARLKAADGNPACEANLAVEQVLITAGSNELLFLLADILIDPGDIVLCGAPCYFVFLGIVNNQGGRSVAVEVDEQGMVPESVDATLARLAAAGQLDRVKAIYVTSYFDNPSSVTVSHERRPKLVEIAQRWSRHESRKEPIYIVEDAAYRELCYDGDDVPSLRAFDESGETVIVTGSFSKSLSPGLRVGFGVLPHSLVEAVLNQKGNIDFGAPNFSQQIVHAVLERGLYEPHIAQLRERYREKRDAMLEAAEKFLRPIEGASWLRPLGGLYVWLSLPKSVDTGPHGTLFDRTLEEGALYVPGEYCHPTEPHDPPRNQIRLSFGVQSALRIGLGIEALSRAVRRVLQDAT